MSIAGAKRLVGAALALAVIACTVAVAFIWLGMANVAANEPHWAVTHWVLETARVRSIKAHASGIQAPSNLADEARVVGGTSHFVDHCAGCHAAPGVPADDMADGMYPKPPVLTNAARQWTPGELFWILKNGIKMSGMPSWADHGDDGLWDIVAFLLRLPDMTEQQYGKLVMASMQAGGHQMPNGMHMGTMPGHSMGDSSQPGSGDSGQEAAPNAIGGSKQ